MASASEGRAVAVVDCGTNSTRLLIATVQDGRVLAFLRRTIITRLGAGVDGSGHLSDDGIGRVVHALEDYVGHWRAAGIVDVAVCATSAVRDAANADRFAERVGDVAGVAPVVLSGSVEAALTFAGATAGDVRRRVVCDIGGGSTELIVGAGAPAHRTSLQLGSVRLRERHLRHDPPTPDEYAALVTAIDAVLQDEIPVYAATDDTPLVAVAGTATTLAAVAQDVAESEVDRIDGLVLPARQLARVIEDLAWLPARERLSHPAIVPGREDVVVAGGLLLSRILACLGFDAVEIRVADLLDGVALRLAAGAWPPATPKSSLPAGGRWDENGEPSPVTPA